MPDPINDAREVVEKAHVHELMEYFKEPGQVSWTQQGIAKVVELYNIAKRHEPEDPLGWIKDFNMSHPLDLDVSQETNRISNILIMADLYTKQKSKETKGVAKSLRRDFQL